MALSNRCVNVVIALIFIMIINPGTCFRCYECDSITYSGCADPLEKKYLNTIECNEITDRYPGHPQIACKKMISKTADGIKVTRGCLPKAEEEDQFTDPSADCITPHFSSDIVCRCHSDLCNGAPVRADNYSPMILSVFLFLLAIRWQLLS